MKTLTLAAVLLMLGGRAVTSAAADRYRTPRGMARTGKEPMKPSTFTIASWNGTNPETFTDWHLARSAAITRAVVEGTAVRFRENAIGLSCVVSPDGKLGAWFEDRETTDVRTENCARSCA